MKLNGFERNLEGIAFKTNGNAEIIKVVWPGLYLELKGMCVSAIC